MRAMTNEERKDADGFLLEHFTSPPPNCPNAYEWMAIALGWIGNAAHRPWCDAAPGNIYSGGAVCDCRKDEIEAALKRILKAEFSRRTKEQP